MSEHIEPNDAEKANRGVEFVSAITPDHDPFEYEGDSFNDMKFVWLSKDTIDSIAKPANEVPEEGMIFVGPLDFMDHWQIVNENLGGGLSRERIRNINVIDAGSFMKADEDTVLVPSVSYSGELRTEDDEMARLNRNKLYELHQRTANYLTELYKDSETPYNFISPK